MTPAVPPPAPSWYRDASTSPRKPFRLWKVLLGIVCGAVLLGMQGQCALPTPTLELYQDYRTTPNGEHPTKFDSGQTATLTYTPNETARPTISDGNSIITYNGAGRGAGYATAQLGATGTY